MDDDVAVRESLIDLFRSIGLSVEAYATSGDAIAARAVEGPGCLVLDVRLPGQSGLDFYEELVRCGIRRPAVFISAHADVAIAVRAMKAGATEVLTKPVRSQALLDAVQSAIEVDAVRCAEAERTAAIVAAFDRLTPREREVMKSVAAGQRNKEIAADLGLSEATVKLHRGHAMQKMGAGSVADLVRMMDEVAAARRTAPAPRPRSR